jgi:hypothetical protein
LTSPIARRWTFLHIAQIVLFGLLGFAGYLLVGNLPSRSG